MNILYLNRENYFGLIEKDYPLSLKKFNSYIDDFRESVNWEQLFNAPCVEDRFISEEKYIGPKFSEIPFLMQKGVMENFFLLNNIQLYSTKHPFNSDKWTFHTIDIIEGAIWTQFTNPNHEVLAEYNTSEEAEVAALTMAFKILNDNLTKNLN